MDATPRPTTIKQDGPAKPRSGKQPLTHPSPKDQTLAQNPSTNTPLMQRPPGLPD